MELNHFVNTSLGSYLYQTSMTILFEAQMTLLNLVAISSSDR